MQLHLICNSEVASPREHRRRHVRIGSGLRAGEEPRGGLPPLRPVPRPRVSITLQEGIIVLGKGHGLFCQHLWATMGAQSEEGREGRSPAPPCQVTYGGHSLYTCAPRAYLGKGQAAQPTWDHLRPGTWGEPLSPRKGGQAGSEWAPEAHPLSREALGSSGRAAVFSGSWVARDPVIVGGGIVPWQCPLELGDQAVTLAGARPPAVLSISVLETKGERWVCVCQYVLSVWLSVLGGAGSPFVPTFPS